METAQYYTLGLRFRIIPKEEVQRWIEQMALRATELEGPLLELTFVRPENIDGIIQILERMDVCEDRFSVLRRLLGRTSERILDDKIKCRDLAKDLYYVYVDSDYNVPDDFNLIGWFDDEYELAFHGVVGRTTDEWHDSFREFVHSFRLDSTESESSQTQI